MKVEYISKDYDALETDGYDDKILIRFDGQTVFEAEDGLAEENHTGCNFQDIHLIPSMLQMAYDAGRRGELLSIEYRDMED